MACSTPKNQLTAYPKGVFYRIQFCQLLAAMIVAGEMFYFIWQLKHGGYRVPWMFFFVSIFFQTSPRLSSGPKGFLLDFILPIC